MGNAWIVASFHATSVCRESKAWIVENFHAMLPPKKFRLPGSAWIVESFHPTLPPQKIKAMEEEIQKNMPIDPLPKKQ
jgi:hypothetical protein